MQHKTATDLQRNETVNHIHIGSLIETELHRQGLSATWLAHEICCDRTNIYKILKKSSIDTKLLCRIAVALKYNFFEKLESACGFTAK